jgi:hypothetical protein
MDQHYRYIDSWTPDAGVTFVNQSFNNDETTCTIKLHFSCPTAGIYAKQDIFLKLLTGYGNP